MKRALLWVVLASVSFAPRLESAAVTCASNHPCKQPPCEFFYELKMAKAMARAWSLPVLKNEQDSSRVIAKMDKAYRKYAKCPANYFYQPPPTFSVSPQCELVYPPGTSSLDQVLASTNSCAEFVRGKYARAEQTRLFCLSNQDVKGPLPEGLFRMQMRLALQEHIQVMEVALGQFLASCAPSATTSRRVTDVGLKALKRQAYKDRMAWAERMVREVAQ